MCHKCLGTLRPGGERLLPAGLRLVAAFEHTGAAVSLIHHLKYRGLMSVAGLVADSLVDVVDPAPLVPVPRAWTRRLKHGVDPALEIASALGRRWGEPVLHSVVRPVHSRRRAGRNHANAVHPMRAKEALSQPVYIVDDVVTTGATATAVVAAIGERSVKSVLAANVVPGVSSLFAL